MANEHDQHPAIITDPERVTGEFAALMGTPAQVWERVTSHGKQFYINDEGLSAAVGAADMPAIPDDPTDAQLFALGFVPCADPVAIAAVRRFLAAWTGDEE